MTVRQRAGDAEGLGRGDKRLALERTFDDLDQVIGKMGQVAERLMGNGLSLADGSSEQMGDVQRRSRIPSTLKVSHVRIIT